MLLVSGLILEWQLDGLVVEVGVFIPGTQLEAAMGSNNEWHEGLLRFSSIGGDGCSDLIDIICTAITCTRLDRQVIDKYIGSIFYREAPVLVGNYSGVGQLPISMFDTVTKPAPPCPFLLSEREAHLGVLNGYTAIGHRLATDLDGLLSGKAAPEVWESNFKRRQFVFTHIDAMVADFIFILIKATFQCDIKRAVFTVGRHDK